jgi:hypothetical protein
MSSVRTGVSISSLLVACAFGSVLGGCYDLSTSGPRPEDFAKSSGATEPQAQDETEAPHAGATELDRSAYAAQPLYVETMGNAPADDYATTVAATAHPAGAPR